MSDIGVGDCSAVKDELWFAFRPDGLRVEFVDADDVVESSGSSTTFQV